jgi:hypothetical protein
VLEVAVTEVESGEALEGLAEALYQEREYAASAARYERAYIAYRREREAMAAGRAARAVAWITGNVLGDWAVRSGWLARALATLKEADEDRPEQGWVLIIEAWVEPDAKTREALLRDAIPAGQLVSQRQGVMRTPLRIAAALELCRPHRAASRPRHKPGRRSRAARLTCAAISGIWSISTSRSAFARTSSRIGDVAVTVARRA